MTPKVVVFAAGAPNRPTRITRLARVRPSKAVSRWGLAVLTLLILSHVAVIRLLVGAIGGISSPLFPL